MASLVIKFADLSQEPVGSGNDVTAEVLVSYTREVPLTDGTVLQAVPTRKQLGAGGTAIFEVTPSDDPTVVEAHRDFGLRVEWLLTHRAGRGRQTETRGARTVKVTAADGATVQFGTLLPIEPVPAKYTSVADFADDLEAQVGAAVGDATQALTAAQAAETSAATAATEAADAADRADAAELAKYATQDSGTATLVGTTGSETRAALDADFAAIPNNGKRAVGKDELVVNINDFGAVGNGSTDDAPAIQAALDYAAANNLPTTAPKGSTYRIDSGIEISGPADFWDVTFAYRGNGTAVRLNGPIRQQWRIGRVVNAQKTIPGFSEVAGSVGVEIYDQSKSLVDIKSVTRFETGVRLFGDIVGTAYNTIRVSELTTNLVNMRLDHGTTGWVNANIIVGGSWQHTPGDTAPPPTERAPGTRHVLITDGARPGNHNTFLGCSFEGDTAEYLVEAHGRMNSFRDCRWESINPHVLWGASSFGNVIRDGYKPWKIIATDLGTAGNVVSWGASGDVAELFVSPRDITSAEGAATHVSWIRHPAIHTTAKSGDILAFTARLPSNWDAFDLKIHYTVDTAGTGTAAWLVRSLPATAGDAMSTPAGGASTSLTVPARRVLSVAKVGSKLAARPPRDMYSEDVDDYTVTVNVITTPSGTYVGEIYVLGFTLTRAGLTT